MSAPPLWGQIHLHRETLRDVVHVDGWYPDRGRVRLSRTFLGTIPPGVTWLAGRRVVTPFRWLGRGQWLATCAGRLVVRLPARERFGGRDLLWVCQVRSPWLAWWLLVEAWSRLRRLWGRWRYGWRPYTTPPLSWESGTVVLASPSAEAAQEFLDRVIVWDDHMTPVNLRAEDDPMLRPPPERWGYPRPGVHVDYVSLAGHVVPVARQNAERLIRERAETGPDTTLPPRVPQRVPAAYVVERGKTDNLYAEIVQARREERWVDYLACCRAAGIPEQYDQEMWDGLGALVRPRRTTSDEVRG